MHFPAMLEKGAHILFGKEIRGAVRPVDDPQLPVAVNIRAQGLRCPGALLRQWLFHQMQYITGAQRPSGKSAKLPEGKGGLRPQVIRTLNASGHHQISARAAGYDFSDGQYLPRLGAHHLAKQNRLIVQGRVQGRTCENKIRGGIELQSRAVEGNLQAGGAFGVTQQTVTQAQ